MIFYAALLTGLMGGFHCLGMCGPLIMAFPQQSRLASFLYHFARAIAYAALGLIAGIFGLGLNLTGVQQWISILSGFLIILLALGVISGKTVMPPVFYRAFNKVAAMQGFGGSMALGFLNGLLPCGMVYVALAGAISAGNIANSALYMLIFGIGTWPMMLAISFSKTLWKPQWRLKAQKLLPWFTIFIGLLFVVRGLNLGIPYLSPKTNAQTEQLDCCHKPNH